jgi:YidC/Oxa1 family membrane protein insertase
MEFKRLLSFAIIAMAILMGWNYFFPAPVQQQAATQATSNSPATQAAGHDAALEKANPIEVKTDVVNAVIDSQSGDLRRLVLMKHDATSDTNKRFVLLDDQKEHTYVAQSALLTKQGEYLFKGPYAVEQREYNLGSQNQVQVKLTAPETDGVLVSKIYTFTKGSYNIGVNFEVKNTTDKAVSLDAMYRMVRDGSKPEGEGSFNQTYSGPVVYTPEGKFEKVNFSDLDKGKADFVSKTNTGWVGMIQHYFMATWLLQLKGQDSICGKEANCVMDVTKRSDGLYSAGVRVALPAVAAGQTTIVPMSLYAGPQVYADIAPLADNLQLVKDYGKVHVFSSPLFWLLNKIHTYVGNWGWAIVLLTLLVKAVLYPLTAASYRSMAKMRAVAPQLQSLKEQYGEDRMKMQQEMMALYKKEKINPLGGCLPMLAQIPVFIGLYWALFASVELRQASWLWINDLARVDPYYILPVVMAVTMFLQTFLNPPPTDPMQAKMMKIMPVVFSVMFFFFPAGLVLYWVVNNILSIAQQWFVNKSIAKKSHKAA